MPRPLEAVIEDARLAALHSYSVLSPQELDGLSRLAREAARSLGATHGAVSFVDAASVSFGGAFGFEGGETGREHSFCDAVVRSAAPMLVPDGSTDPRFWHHALVQGGPGLRSYAGVPLVDHGGYVLGTVAVYSTERDVFASETLHDLGGLAGLIRDFLADSRVAPGIAADLPPPTPRIQGWLGVKTLRSEDGERGTVAGLTVLSIAKGSPARSAGLRPTDILQSIDGRELFVASDVAAAMTGRAMGSTVRIRFRRAGRWHECDVAVRSRLTRVSGR